MSDVSIADLESQAYQEGYKAAQDEIIAKANKIRKLEQDLASCKAFHKNICQIVRWYHDDNDWCRDLASVEQAIRDEIKGRGR